ncbi:MAG: hypothetical protein JXR52_08225 [Bacteroidales bacterium]|nr:hypothetical protein [Bacteroidales bacterium]MBN2698797.1 hypothetical protein [Bacteroidales bacterium]
MEKDKNIEKLIRESGLSHTGDGFTKRVMDRVYAQPVPRVYKPLIGNTGKIFILTFLLVLVVVSVIFSEPSEFFSLQQIKLPDWDMHPEKLYGTVLSTGLLAILFAVFILVIADAVVRKRKYI